MNQTCQTSNYKTTEVQSEPSLSTSHAAPSKCTPPRNAAIIIARRAPTAFVHRTSAGLLCSQAAEPSHGGCGFSNLACVVRILPAVLVAQQTRVPTYLAPLYCESNDSARAERGRRNNGDQRGSPNLPRKPQRSRCRRLSCAFHQRGLVSLYRRL